MKKTITIFIIGIITGVTLFYGYYSYEYKEYISSIAIKHTIKISKAIINAAVPIIAGIISLLVVLAISYIIWIYLIKKIHKKLKQQQEEIQKQLDIIKSEKAKLEEERKNLYTEFENKLEEQKRKLENQTKREIEKYRRIYEEKTKKEFLMYYFWRKEETKEKESLKRKIKCLEEKIYQLILKKAEKYKETNPGRYKKELKKTKKIIDDCKNSNKQN